jgi:hypothetical protein
MSSRRHRDVDDEEMGGAGVEAESMTSYERVTESDRQMIEVVAFVAADSALVGAACRRRCGFVRCSAGD